MQMLCARGEFPRHLFELALLRATAVPVAPETSDAVLGFNSSDDRQPRRAFSRAKSQIHRRIDRLQRFIEGRAQHRRSTYRLVHEASYGIAESLEIGHKFHET